MDTREVEASPDPRHSSEFVRSLAQANGKNRPICDSQSVSPTGDFDSDFGWLTFGTLRERSLNFLCSALVGGPCSLKSLDSTRCEPLPSPHSTLGKSACD